jgi:putative flippase GtrA
MPRLSQLIRFGMAGVAGFLVDAGVLQATLALGMSFYLGRVISFLAAATATWLINRRLTFAHAGQQPASFREWWRYVGAMMVGGAVNYLVSALVFQGVLKADPRSAIIAVAVGSIAAMVVNFIAARAIIQK